MRSYHYLFLLFTASAIVNAQDTLYRNPAFRHSIHSAQLGEVREYWVSLPVQYADSNQYPVIYVLDAEWRFDLVRHMAYDMGGNGDIERSIVVGIPHVAWEHQRGIDLTFSQSRKEYDGEVVDSTTYHAGNSGGGLQFYRYLTDELLPDVDRRYPTTGHETLIGHSYGGYFGAYLLSLPHPFEVLHIYDPPVWFGDGEVIHRFMDRSDEVTTPVDVYLTYQGIPDFHREKIEELIEVLFADDHIQLSTRYYFTGKSHNGLFLDSFYQGIQITH